MMKALLVSRQIDLHVYMLAYNIPLLNMIARALAFKMTHCVYGKGQIQRKEGSERDVPELWSSDSPARSVTCRRQWDG